MGDEDRNLLHETIEDLGYHEKQPADVRWVGNRDFWFTWAEFTALADRTYNAGFGGQEVATDLLVVGDDWWLERHEYDGSEWWEYKSTPVKPADHAVPTALIRTGLWEALQRP